MSEEQQRLYREILGEPPSPSHGAGWDPIRSRREPQHVAHTSEHEAQPRSDIQCRVAQARSRKWHSGGAPLSRRQRQADAIQSGNAMRSGNRWDSKRQ